MHLKRLLEWNQADLGQVLHIRLGICTLVRGPGPRPSGSHRQTATVPDDSGTTRRKARENSKSRLHESTTTVHLEYEL